MPDDPLDSLYAAPPDEFVPARDALAKALRADGDRDGAARVRALRKPTRAAWAVNAAVRERPQAAGELADAARRLQDVQQEVLAGGDATLLRAADARARAAVDALASAAPTTDVATADKVHATLRAATVDPDVLAEVLAGRLGHEQVASGFGGFGIALAADAAAVAKPAKPARRARRARGGRAAAGDAVAEPASAAETQRVGAEQAADGAEPASAAESKRARAEQAAEEKRRRAQERAARAAERAEQRRQERLRRAREAESEAEAEVAAARSALDQVEAVARERREQLDAAEARLDQARARVARENER